MQRTWNCWRRFSSSRARAGDWSLWENVISSQDESAIIEELQPILDRLEWSRDHFDRVIFNYRETTISDPTRYPHLNKFFIATVKPLFDDTKNTILPIHLLELDAGGYIRPHIDNLEASGSMIAGLSLKSDCTLRFSSSSSGDCWQQIVPQRSLYLQRYIFASSLIIII